MIPDIAGRRLLVADLIGTVALLVVTVIEGVTGDDAATMASLVVSAVLFVGGSVGFTIGFLRAVGRSRTEAIHLAGLFYLTAAAPDAARRAFLGLWYVQIAIAAASLAVAEPPFAAMAPVWGIGLITWWSSVHGTFPPRQTPSPR